MKYETARTWRFNVWLVLASSIVTSGFAIVQAWNHITSGMSEWKRELFVKWIEAWVKWKFFPGGSITQGGSADLILRVNSVPKIEAEFYYAAEKIFIYAPVIAIAATIVLFVFGHAVAKYLNRNKKGETS